MAEEARAACMLKRCLMIWGGASGGGQSALDCRGKIAVSSQPSAFSQGAGAAVVPAHRDGVLRLAGRRATSARAGSGEVHAQTIGDDLPDPEGWVKAKRASPRMLMLKRRPS